MGGLTPEPAEPVLLESPDPPAAPKMVVEPMIDVPVVEPSESVS